ncbi:MAG: dTMP kinase [Proteobacteria bacterium]|nr:dTMP kinase [Pseudomonadota bacterium]
MPSSLFATSPALFITFEGGEGVGKSTQIRMLRTALEENGLLNRVVMTREPGGCDNALALRKMLVEGDADRWDGLSESLLYSAARNEHLREVIRPELAGGRWVLCDRFADSTTVYQGEGRGMPKSVLDYLSGLVVGNTWPNLTFIMDMPAGDGLFRARGRQENMFENRFESLQDSFHERVRQGFLRIARENPDRCRVIDAQGTPEEVHARVFSTLVAYVQERAA